MKIFQYAVIYNPKDEGKRSQLVVPITTVLAKDAQAVMLVAAREIPEDYMALLGECEVVVRPF